MTKRRRRGFTLIELMIVTVIMGILAALAIPNYSRVRERAMNTRAIGDIRTIHLDIQDFLIRTGALPTTLANIGRGGLLDPWGHPYSYLPIVGAKGKGGFRKDRFLVPINSDYDLYSMGADGATAAPLTAKNSQDDIIRANDGGFIGVAANF